MGGVNQSVTRRRTSFLKLAFWVSLSYQAKIRIKVDVAARYVNVMANVGDRNLRNEANKRLFFQIDDIARRCQEPRTHFLDIDARQIGARRGDRERRAARHLPRRRRSYTRARSLN